MGVTWLGHGMAKGTGVRGWLVLNGDCKGRPKGKVRGPRGQLRCGCRVRRGMAGVGEKGKVLLGAMGDGALGGTAAGGLRCWRLAQGWGWGVRGALWGGLSWGAVGGARGRLVG